MKTIYPVIKKNFGFAFILILIMWILSIFGVSAQPPGEKEDIESRRIGFLTKELQLTPEEAKVFWPVYNKYRSEMDALRKDRATELLNARMSFDNMSDDEVSRLIDNEMNLRQKELEIQRRYNTEFKKILPVKKVARLYRAEQQFKVNLIRDMKQASPAHGSGGRVPQKK